jgi:hypothetical protein
VERAHAVALEALVTVADLVIVVTTPARYGDAVPWDLLARVQRLGSLGWVVMNRVRADLEGRLQVGHLVARATAAGFEVAADQVLRIPERPGIGVVPEDVVELADVLAEVGRDDAAAVIAHARLRAAADVASDVREWLDAVDDVVAGAGRRARTSAASSAAERETLAEDLLADPPGRSAHGAALLRLRSGSDPNDIEGRLSDAVVADLGARFGLAPDRATALLSEALEGVSGETRLAILLGTADESDMGGYSLRLSAGLVGSGVAEVPSLPAGLTGAVDHLHRLVGRPVPA